ncbi:pyruvate, phosphate dikinase [Chelativorans sp. SCAU2101]|uniref:Pyruvate, phosphate dikinase n=1 Tax=Chelativorans petroleitrophicus TaxID=2975484 RepID=A0A9X3B092_9HYPH|nr:pyruvate, phosphate dikinase [Chelativorans petroleitrophicus]MCT8991460.1 pyruvate, phosphate dikinase [Chelativorans petroleitrophicus]
MTKWTYSFGDGQAEGSAGDRDLLGSKGSNLAEMCRLGLPVPPGFTITSEACTYFHVHEGSWPPELESQVENALRELERITGREFGGAQHPLLVSVRPGSRVILPGMLDTVLNVGLNDRTVKALALESGDARFAYDSYRRFIQMYGEMVLGLAHDLFEEILDEEKASRGYDVDTEFSAEDWQDVIARFKAQVEVESGEPFPQDPCRQLWSAIKAVFGSWRSPRAVTYRSLHNIRDDWGTAVNVQLMVFGNMGRDSATGIACTRNPSTGEKGLYGEFLVNAQGEDVVSGIRTAQHLTERARREARSGLPSLEKLMPEPFAALAEIAGRLEAHFRDMQDLEFTIERGKLWMLHTRTGKRTTRAALRMAVEMAEEGLISRAEALCRIDPGALDSFLHPTIDPEAQGEVIAVGLPASPGAVTGEIVFSSEEAERMTAHGAKVILVRVETSPDDVHGMHVAEGIVTTRGGMTSHAAVVARGMGKPCVSGAGTLRIDYRAGTVSALGRSFRRGDIITIDGSTGQVLAGAVPLRQPVLSGDFSTVMQWAEENRRMKVRANAETPDDARAARAFGAEGIGLCRTEHMFFGPDRISVMREMILSDTQARRREALDKLLPLQRADFTELFEIMAGLPVAIRLLDPPLHEFLPGDPQDIARIAERMKVDAESLLHRIESLREQNPMLGHRGCRLAISYPEIAEMQARALFEAAVEAAGRTGMPVVPEIIVPFVSTASEFSFVKKIIDRVAVKVLKEKKAAIDYLVGAMIELPRAALNAGEIAREAEFFSFGTNDLTQTTFGISRDDAGDYLEDYRRQRIIEQDPFVTLDLDGVGALVRLAAEKGRAARPGLRLGVCGEHGGDPASISFFEEIGLDYVSCSPFRLPIARLSAAQACCRPH